MMLMCSNFFFFFAYQMSVYQKNNFVSTEMNPCLADPCSHSCSVEAPGTFTCTCPDNMQLDSSEVNCIGKVSINLNWHSQFSRAYMKRTLKNHFPISALPLPTPINLRFSRITHTSAKASWEIGNYDERFIDHYVLVYTRADGVGENTLLRIGMLTKGIIKVWKEDFKQHN